MIDPAERARTYSRLLANVSAPVGVLDLDAVDANADDLVRRAGGTPLRLATKSLRVPGLIRYLLERDGFQGVFAYTLPEALYLHGKGFSDIVVGYPTTDRAALDELMHDEAAAATITLMVDSVEHLDYIDSIAGPQDRCALRLCLELDASYRIPGTTVSVGARRSPIKTPRQSAGAAAKIVDRAGFTLVGMLAYESQIAGISDDARTVRGALIRLIQQKSRKQISRRRAEAVAAVRRIAHLEFVNGGGTGSIESTSRESAVTEIAAGSGIMAPAIFDHYRAFTPTPAAYFGLDVVRRPAHDIAAVLGGGWIASGPIGDDRRPVISYPEGLEYVAAEQAGEVQTPVRGNAARDLRIGDRAWFRHAKAGEVCEHLDSLQLIRGNDHMGAWKTYRGEGQLFL